MRVSPVIYHLPLHSWPAPLVDDEERLACALVQLQTMAGHAYEQSSDSLLWYTILFILPEQVRINKEGFNTMGASNIHVSRTMRVSYEFTFHVYTIRET